MTPRQRTYGRGRVFRKKENGIEVGNCRIRYYVNGDPREESTGTTDWAVATRILNERIGDVVTGKAPVAGIQRITIADLLDDLIAHQEVERYPSLRTTRTHDAILRPWFGKIRAASLQRKNLDQFVTAMRKPQNRDRGKPKPYAEATIGRMLDTLKSAMNLARAASPPKLLTVPVFPAIDESGNVRTGFVTVPQRDVILERLAMRDTDLAAFVEWLFWTGMRVGAASRLGWDLWDQETGILRLPTPGRKKRTPKAIPLRKGNPLRVILDRRWERRKERGKETGRLEPLIFWRVHRGGPTKHGLLQGDTVPVYEFRKLWASACKVAGCPNLTPHDLRRTAIRNLWLATRDRRLCKLVSGHATDSMLDRYNIETPDEMGDALDQVAGYVDSLPRKGPGSVRTLPRRSRPRKVAG
jgi:integrase